MTPLLIAALVGGIGVFGIVSALHANSGIRTEIDILRRGRRMLEDLPMDQPRDFDYRTWMIEQNARLCDSHFGDHLFAAADATRSGRAVTLHEFHQLSARREARRKAARISGGITALLLVCGIAGTLIAIEPILGGFQITADSAGVSNAAENVEKATFLIQSLGQAFLPSLVALALTVIVALTRGFYSQSRGHLAGKLDDLDLQDLFHRFPPPSISRELNDIRVQLAELATQMLASQRNMDDFVQRLSDASTGFQKDTPPIQKASIDFVQGVLKLTPTMVSLDNTITQHFGVASPLVEKLDGVIAVSEAVKKTSAHMESAGNLLEQSMKQTHRILEETAASIDHQIRTAGQEVATNIAQAASIAIRDSFESVVQQINIAAEPLQQAAIAATRENTALKTEMTHVVKDLENKIEVLLSENTAEMRSEVTQAVEIARTPLEKAAGAITKVSDALRTDTHQTVEALTKRIETLVSRSTKTLREKLNHNNDTMIEQFNLALTQVRQEFNDSIRDNLKTMEGIESSSMDVFDRLQVNIADMDQLKEQMISATIAAQNVSESITSTKQEISQSSVLLLKTTQDLTNTTNVLTGAGEISKSITDRLVDLGNSLVTSHSISNDLQSEFQRLQTTQIQAAETIRMIMEQAMATNDAWSKLVSESEIQQQTGQRMKEDFGELLKKAVEITSQLALNAESAAHQQQLIAAELEKINFAIDEINKFQKAGLLGRFFSNRG